MSVTLGDLDNQDDAEEMFEAVKDKQRGERLENADALATKQRLEEKQQESFETVSVGVLGESIEMETLSGMGEQTHLPRRLIEAERAGDEMEQLIVLDDMIEVLAEKSDDPFDRAFWNRFDQDVISDTYESLALKSRGGDDAGN